MKKKIVALITALCFMLTSCVSLLTDSDIRTRGGNGYTPVAIAIDGRDYTSNEKFKSNLPAAFAFDEKTVEAPLTFTVLDFHDGGDENSENNYFLYFYQSFIDTKIYQKNLIDYKDKLAKYNAYVEQNYANKYNREHAGDTSGTTDEHGFYEHTTDAAYVVPTYANGDPMLATDADGHYFVPTDPPVTATTGVPDGATTGVPDAPEPAPEVPEAPEPPVSDKMIIVVAKYYYNKPSQELTMPEYEQTTEPEGGDTPAEVPRRPGERSVIKQVKPAKTATGEKAPGTYVVIYQDELDKANGDYHLVDTETGEKIPADSDVPYKREQVPVAFIKAPFDIQPYYKNDDTKKPDNIEISKAMLYYNNRIMMLNTRLGTVLYDYDITLAIEDFNESAVKDGKFNRSNISVTDVLCLDGGNRFAVYATVARYPDNYVPPTSAELLQGNYDAENNADSGKHASSKTTEGGVPPDEFDKEAAGTLVFTGTLEVEKPNINDYGITSAVIPAGSDDSGDDDDDDTHKYSVKIEKDKSEFTVQKNGELNFSADDVEMTDTTTGRGYTVKLITDNTVQPDDEDPPTDPEDSEDTYTTPTNILYKDGYFSLNLIGTLSDSNTYAFTSTALDSIMTNIDKSEGLKATVQHFKDSISSQLTSNRNIVNNTASTATEKTNAQKFIDDNSGAVSALDTMLAQIERVRNLVAIVKSESTEQRYKLAAVSEIKRIMNPDNNVFEPVPFALTNSYGVWGGNWTDFKSSVKAALGMITDVKNTPVSAATRIAELQNEAGDTSGPFYAALNDIINNGGVKPNELHIAQDIRNAVDAVAAYPAYTPPAATTGTGTGTDFETGFKAAVDAEAADEAAAVQYIKGFIPLCQTFTAENITAILKTDKLQPTYVGKGFFIGTLNEIMPVLNEAISPPEKTVHITFDGRMELTDTADPPTNKHNFKLTSSSMTIVEDQVVTGTYDSGGNFISDDDIIYTDNTEAARTAEATFSNDVNAAGTTSGTTAGDSESELDIDNHTPPQMDSDVMQAMLMIMPRDITLNTRLGYKRYNIIVDLLKGTSTYDFRSTDGKNVTAKLENNVGPDWYLDILSGTPKALDETNLLHGEKIHMEYRFPEVKKDSDGEIKTNNDGNPQFNYRKNRWDARAVLVGQADSISNVKNRNVSIINTLNGWHEGTPFPLVWPFASLTPPLNTSNTTVRDIIENGDEPWGANDPRRIFSLWSVFGVDRSEVSEYRQKYVTTKLYAALNPQNSYVLAYKYYMDEIIAKPVQNPYSTHDSTEDRSEELNFVYGASIASSNHNTKSYTYPDRNGSDVADPIEFFGNLSANGHGGYLSTDGGTIFFTGHQVIYDPFSAAKIKKRWDFLTTFPISDIDAYYSDTSHGDTYRPENVIHYKYYTRGSIETQDRFIFSTPKNGVVMYIPSKGEKGKSVTRIPDIAAYHSWLIDDGKKLITIGFDGMDFGYLPTDIWGSRIIINKISDFKSPPISEMRGQFTFNGKLTPIVKVVTNVDADGNPIEGSFEVTYDTDPNKAIAVDIQMSDHPFSPSTEELEQSARDGVPPPKPGTVPETNVIKISQDGSLSLSGSGTFKKGSDKGVFTFGAVKHVAMEEFENKIEANGTIHLSFPECPFQITTADNITAEIGKMSMVIDGIISVDGTNKHKFKIENVTVTLNDQRYALGGNGITHAIAGKNEITANLEIANTTVVEDTTTAVESTTT